MDGGLGRVLWAVNGVFGALLDGIGGMVFVFRPFCFFPLGFLGVLYDCRYYLYPQHSPVSVEMVEAA